MNTLTKKSVRAALGKGCESDPESVCRWILGKHRNVAESDSYTRRHINRAALCLDAIHGNQQAEDAIARLAAESKKAVAS